MRYKPIKMTINPAKRFSTLQETPLGYMTYARNSVVFYTIKKYGKYCLENNESLNGQSQTLCYKVFTDPCFFEF